LQACHGCPADHGSHADVIPARVVECNNCPTNRGKCYRRGGNCYTAPMPFLGRSTVSLPGANNRVPPLRIVSGVDSHGNRKEEGEGGSSRLAKVTSLGLLIITVCTKILSTVMALQVACQESEERRAEINSDGGGLTFAPSGFASEKCNNCPAHVCNNCPPCGH
jgi:hypothetical protein